MMWDWPFGSGGWVFGSFMIVIVLAFIVIGVVLVARGFSGREGSASGQGPSNKPAGSGSALEILEERYARGDIDREEFLKRKKDLLDK